jgi:hypothetical protein
MKLKLLINPISKGAYFSDILSVSQSELRCFYPQLNINISRVGSLDFLDIELPSEELHQLSRLSFVQGIFEQKEHNLLSTVDISPQFNLPEELVWGNKYKGKTNEIVTQLAINVGMQYAPTIEGKTTVKLLDPMAGRGTTLLWAARYGIDAIGIERNREALDHFCRHVKRQCKLHRIKHRYIQGNIGKKNKLGLGGFHEVQWEHCKSKLIIGDSSNLTSSFLSDRFHLIVCDIPYGIQFFGKGGQRNPHQLIETCAQTWIERLYPEGIIVIIFNSFQPKRKHLIEVFEKNHLEKIEFEAPHRMSESIKRDLVVFKKTIL